MEKYMYKCLLVNDLNEANETLTEVLLCDIIHI